MSQDIDVIQDQMQYKHTNANLKTTTKLFYSLCLVFYLGFQAVKNLGPFVVIHIRKLLPNIIHII